MEKEDGQTEESRDMLDRTSTLIPRSWTLWVTNNDDWLIHSMCYLNKEEAEHALKKFKAEDSTITYQLHENCERIRKCDGEVIELRSTIINKCQ